MVQKDRGYAWVVMIAALLTNILAGGFVVCPSLLLVEWYSTFGASKSATALTVSILNGSRALTGVLAGVLITRYGCRAVQLAGALTTAAGLLAFAFTPSLTGLFFISAFTGVGVALMGTPPIVVIYEYFDKYKSLASGISLMGHSLAAFVMVAVCRFSIDYYGWRGAMFILSGLSLNACVFAMLMFPTQPQSGAKPPAGKGVADIFNVRLLANGNFMLFLLGSVIAIAQIDCVYSLSVARAVTKGVPLLHASFLTTMVGAVSTVSRFVSSIISNMKCTSHVGVYGGSILGLSLLILLSCLRADMFTYAAVMCGGCGVFIGSFNTMMPPSLVDILGQPHLASALGWWNTFIGVQYLLTLPIMGHIYDRTGDFNIPFYIVGFVGLLGACLLAIVTINVHRRENAARRLEDAENTLKAGAGGGLVEEAGDSCGALTAGQVDDESDCRQEGAADVSLTARRKAGNPDDIAGDLYRAEDTAEVWQKAT